MGILSKKGPPKTVEMAPRADEWVEEVLPQKYRDPQKLKQWVDKKFGQGNCELRVCPPPPNTDTHNPQRKTRIWYIFVISDI
jgi:hypothetical protein